MLKQHLTNLCTKLARFKYAEVYEQITSQGPAKPSLKATIEDDWGVETSITQALFFSNIYFYLAPVIYRIH